MKITIMVTVIMIFACRAQGVWNLEEETNLVGSISGSVQNGDIFKTASGSIYEVTSMPLMLVLELSPEVVVLRNNDSYLLVVDGFEELLVCKQLKPSTKKTYSDKEAMFTRIDGEFTGWDGETIFKLINGQIWEQASYSYIYKYKYGPKVLIYPYKGRFKMKVEGVEKTIYVNRLK